MKKQFFECIKYYINLYNQTDKEHIKKNINKYLIKSFTKMDLHKVNLKKIKINNPDQIFQIISEGNIKFMESISLRKYICWDFFDKTGLSPYHYAISYGDLRMVKMMLLTGVNINQVTRNGNFAFELACNEKDVNMINYLIKNGVNLKKNSQIRSRIGNIPILSDSIDIPFILTMLSDGVNLKELQNYAKEYEKLLPKIDFPYGYDGITYYDVINLIMYHANDGKLIAFQDTIIQIVTEELGDKNIFNNNENDLTCPVNKLDNILLSLSIFLDPKYQVNSEWLINYEMMSMANVVKENLLKKRKTNKFEEIYDEYKKTLVKKINEAYLKPKLYTDEFLINIRTKWLDIF